MRSELKIVKLTSIIQKIEVWKMEKMMESILMGIFLGIMRVFRVILMLYRGERD